MATTTIVREQLIHLFIAQWGPNDLAMRELFVSALRRLLREHNWANGSLDRADPRLAAFMASTAELANAARALAPYLDGQGETATVPADAIRHLLACAKSVRDSLFGPMEAEAQTE